MTTLLRSCFISLLALPAACSAPEARPSADAEVDLAEARSIVEREVDLSHLLPGVQPGDATFVLLKAGTGEVIRHNPGRSGERFIPASTFKIPNSLIALETGVVSGADHLIQWNGVRSTDGSFWADAWSGDHTLRSAMRNSVYWYYQEVARQVGATRMQQYLDRFDYGNRSLGGGIDRFWLRGDLRISADEQVRFLRRMYDGELGLSERTTQVVRDILVLDSAADFRISGKTGTADLTPTRELAWLVGFVEQPGDTWFYAMNVEGEEVWDRWGNPGARLDLVRSLLHAAGRATKQDP